VVHHEPAEQQVVIFGSSAAVPPVTSDLEKAGRQTVVVATVGRSALPEEVDRIAGGPVLEADGA
jgi:hypothetical protein